MENILLIFLKDLKNVDEFNDIINEFEKNNYSMYLTDIKVDKYFSVDSLPEIVNYYKNEHQDINKIVVLSNSRDLIFSWYRCYNSVVDDFIYFVDEEENNYFDVTDNHYDFFENLSKLYGIEKETIKGKIHININFNNYSKLINFLIQNNNFKYFNSLDVFDYKAKYDNLNVLRLSKKYKFNGYEYNFYFEDEVANEIIELQKASNQDIQINDIFVKDVLNNNYIIPYLTVEFFRAKNQALTKVLLIIFKSLKTFDFKYQNKVFRVLLAYLNGNSIDFKEKIYISSLLVMIDNGDEKLTEFIMNTLLDDNDYVEYHYEVITNILFYHTNENLPYHLNFYSDLRNKIGKLTNWISKDLRKNRYNKKGDNKKIAIVVDQLMSIQHSPTKLMLDYAKNIIKYHPEYTVKIFVEDNLYCKNQLNIIPYLYTSAKSCSISDEHYKYLDNDSIEIYYTDVKLNKKDRTRDLINEIIGFNPSFILTNSDISLACRFFYKQIPIVYMSMGGDYFSNLADAYLCISKNKVLNNNNIYNLLDEAKIYEFRYGLEFSEPRKTIRRSHYNINENDFAMITVGNRLDAELDAEFIDRIISFLYANKDARWLMVGPKTIPYIEKEYKELLSSQIILIKYESDLAALYRICDVYLNPRRKGGGISVAMAMNNELPIMITRDSTDGVSYVGIENAVDNLNEYIKKLEILSTEKDCREVEGKNMKKRILLYTMENSIRTLFSIINKECINEN